MRLPIIVQLQSKQARGKSLGEDKVSIVCESYDKISNIHETRLNVHTFVLYMGIISMYLFVQAVKGKIGS